MANQFNKTYTNITVNWQPTPPDLPKAYNESSVGYDNCTQQGRPGPQGANLTNWVMVPDWPYPIADTDSVCTIANSSYVYPCCQALKGETRLDCRTIICRLSVDGNENTTFERWSECTVQLASQVKDPTPLMNCQPGRLLNENREKNSRAPRRTTVLPLAVVVLLAAVAAAA